jgi:hypothetical protein
MQNAPSDDPRSSIGNESCHSVVANLVTLIKHLNASRKVLEGAIGREIAHGGLDMHEEFVVLDDVTPCYLSANAALNACNAALAVTLRALLGTDPTKVESRGSEELIAVQLASLHAGSGATDCSAGVTHPSASRKARAPFSCVFRAGTGCPFLLR